MQKFIDFIIDLANDECEQLVDYNAQYYFRHGGCYEFAKIINHFVKKSQIIINNQGDHLGILFDGRMYDSYGEITHTDDFRLVTDLDLEQDYGMPEKLYVGSKTISAFLTDYIEDIRLPKEITRHLIQDDELTL